MYVNPTIITTPTTLETLLRHFLSDFVKPRFIIQFREVLSPLYHPWHISPTNLKCSLYFSFNIDNNCCESQSKASLKKNHDSECSITPITPGILPPNANCGIFYSCGSQPMADLQFYHPSTTPGIPPKLPTLSFFN